MPVAIALCAAICCQFAFCKRAGGESGFCFAAFKLSQGVFEALGGFLQLTLESVYLFGDVRKLPFGKRSSLGNLVSGAVRSAHGGSDFHRDPSEFVFPGHVEPPCEIGAILYHTREDGILILEKLPGRAEAKRKTDSSRSSVPQRHPGCKRRK